MTTVLLTGCSTVAYYAQSIGGQLDLLGRRQPVEQIIGDDATDAALRARLHEAVRIRDFASRELALPDNGSYRSYAELDRLYAVWAVFAAPEFSLTPRQWCFPVTGCIAYRGYFKEAAADRFAAALRDQGLDVHVGGVLAYSTLGWFDDPLLNTFVGLPRSQLALLIFHELAHQRLYVKGDTTFNESYASAVAEAGVERYLTRHGNADERARFQTLLARQSAFVDLVAETRTGLAALYRSRLAPEAMRRRKAALFAAMRTRYEALREQWGGEGAYDAWFAGELNNARLISVAAYRDWVPAFRTLLARHGGDLAAFHNAVESIGVLPAAARQQRLAELIRPNQP